MDAPGSEYEGHYNTPRQKPAEARLKKVLEGSHAGRGKAWIAKEKKKKGRRESSKRGPMRRSRSAVDPHGFNQGEICRRPRHAVPVNPALPLGGVDDDRGVVVVVVDRVVGVGRLPAGRRR